MAIANAILTMKDAAATGLYQIAEEIMTESKQRVPVDTGNLMNSGHVTQPNIQPEQIAVRLGFGGPAGSGNQGQTNDDYVGYAAIVHEDLEAFHTRGEAKYLESVIREYAPHLLTRVAHFIAIGTTVIRGTPGQSQSKASAGGTGLL